MEPNEVEVKLAWPLVGQDVNYTPDKPSYEGQVQSARIVRVWSAEAVNLLVFLDGSNDGGKAGEYIQWQTSVLVDPEAKRPRSWHYTWQVR